ncbi:MAG: hypothetical protein ACJA0E_000794 [Bermanella sp.]|jgi:hypothetical protein
MAHGVKSGGLKLVSLIFSVENNVPVHVKVMEISTDNASKVLRIKLVG